MMSIKKISIPILCLLVAGLISGCGIQQAVQPKPEKFPTKPITVIVPFAAGGSVDMIARAMEKKSIQFLGQPFIVTNMPGGGATIGWNELIKSKPDGYTLGITTTAAILQPFYGQTKYHYPTALEPLAQIATIPVLIAVSSDRPWQSIDDVVQYARQHPGEIKFGHPGLGTAFHVVGETFAKEANINITQVPFQGDTEELAALMGGHIQLIIASPAIKELVRSGKIRVLAVAGEHRLSDPVFKDVPTLKEQGINVVFSHWNGIAAPKDMPANIKAQLAERLKNIIEDPEVKASIEDMGMTVEYLGPEESVNKWVSDSDRLSKIVKETGIVERIAAQKK
jgi:tripartite-type tricarboxylate transporter receptor subunit TctC